MLEPVTRVVAVEKKKADTQYMADESLDWLEAI